MCGMGAAPGAGALEHAQCRVVERRGTLQPFGQPCGIDRFAIDRPGVAALGRHMLTGADIGVDLARAALPGISAVAAGGANRLAESHDGADAQVEAIAGALPPRLRHGLALRYAEQIGQQALGRRQRGGLVQRGRGADIAEQMGPARMVGQVAEGAGGGVAEPGRERGVEGIARVIVAQPPLGREDGERLRIDADPNEVQAHAAAFGQAMRPWITRRSPAWTPAGQWRSSVSSSSRAPVATVSPVCSP